MDFSYTVLYVYSLPGAYGYYGRLLPYGEVAQKLHDDHKQLQWGQGLSHHHHHRLLIQPI